MFKVDKLSKADVQYEHPARKSNHCAMCKHFSPPNACEVVKGVIAPFDWCNRFRKAPKS